MTPAEEQFAFYFTVGLAITQWAHVEHNLLYVLSSCYGDKSWIALSNTFFSVENFRSKLAAVDNTLKAQFPDSPVLADWPSLHEKARRLSQHRNHMAHWPVVVYPDRKPGQRYLSVQRLQKPPKMRGRPQIRPQASLCLIDVEKLRLEFSALSIGLMNFRARLIGQPEPFPKSEERAARPRKIQQIARQMREVLALQQQPSRA